MTSCQADSATCWGRHLAAAADSIFLEKFGSGPRRSLRRSAERPARAAWAALRLLADVAIGATMELQRSWRTLLLMMLLLRPHGAGEPRGHRQQAALKDQRFRAWAALRLQADVAIGATMELGRSRRSAPASYGVVAEAWH